MAVRPILLLGNPALYVASVPMREAELKGTPQLFEDLRDTLLDFLARQGTAKAIAAPQAGFATRVIYVHEPGPSRFLINPVLEVSGPETLETWEDCMSFPELFVRTRRFAACSVTYRDQDWKERREFARGGLAVLLQHECDHLDGILSVARAADARSFCLASQRGFLSRSSGVGRTGLRPNSPG